MSGVLPVGPPRCSILLMLTLFWFQHWILLSPSVSHTQSIAKMLEIVIADDA